MPRRESWVCVRAQFGDEGSGWSGKKINAEAVLVDGAGERALAKYKSTGFPINSMPRVIAASENVEFTRR